MLFQLLTCLYSSLLVPWSLSFTIDLSFSTRARSSGRGHLTIFAGLFEEHGPLPSIFLVPLLSLRNPVIFNAICHSPRRQHYRRRQTILTTTALLGP